VRAVIEKIETFPWKQKDYWDIKQTVSYVVGGKVKAVIRREIPRNETRKKRKKDSGYFRGL